MSRRGWLLFIAMGVIWGIPYLLIKVAVADLHPTVLVLFRTSIGALLLVPLAAAAATDAPVPPNIMNPSQMRRQRAPAETVGGVSKPRGRDGVPLGVLLGVGVPTPATGPGVEVSLGEGVGLGLGAASGVAVGSGAGVAFATVVGVADGRRVGVGVELASLWGSLSALALALAQR